MTVSQEKERSRIGDKTKKGQESKNRTTRQNRKEGAREVIGDYNYLLEGEESRDTIMICSDGEEKGDRRRILRKRGSPSTTGLRAEKERLRLEREKIEEMIREQEMLNKKRTLTDRKGRLRSDLEEEKIEELKENPTMDLSAEVLEQATLINNVADISKNLKGTIVKVLRDAAATIKAAITVLADRVQRGSGYEIDRERE